MLKIDKCPHLLNVKDDNVNAVENGVCLMYGTVKDINNARYSLFVKAKRDQETLPPTNKK